MKADAGTNGKKRAGARQALWIALAALVALECGARLVLWARKSDERPWTARATADCLKGKGWRAAYFAELERVFSTPGKWHGYECWRKRPFHGKYITVDRDGLRATWNAGGGKRVRIFMLGGSAMWGVGARDGHTIASEVARLFARDGRYRVEVVNFGQFGYVSGQGLLTLDAELRNSNIPDVAVFYDGVNDTFSTWSNGQAGLPLNEADRQREFQILSGFRRRDLYVEAARGFADGTGIGRLLRGVMRRAEGSENRPLWKEAEVRAGRETARAYAENVRMAEALGKAYGFRTLFYWQPTLFGKRNPSASERDELRRRGGTAAIYTEANSAIGRNAALEADPEFHDLSGMFRDEGAPMFIDFCHVCEEADRAIARRIYEDLVETLKARGPRAR